MDNTFDINEEAVEQALGYCGLEAHIRELLQGQVLVSCFSYSASNAVLFVDML